MQDRKVSVPQWYLSDTTACRKPKSTQDWRNESSISLSLLTFSQTLSSKALPKHAATFNPVLIFVDKLFICFLQHEWYDKSVQRPNNTDKLKVCVPLSCV